MRWFWLIALSALLFLGVGYAVFVKKDSVTEVPYVAPELERDYTNTTFGFSLKMPEGFTVGELPPDEKNAHTILLQNSKGEGIQIYVTPVPEDIPNLSASDIRAQIPDMRVSDEQVVEIGEDRTGVAFKSDNEAFGGDSREVWFVFRGNLYQASTYARFDSLLQAMFGTWQFL